MGFSNEKDEVFLMRSLVDALAHDVDDVALIAPSSATITVVGFAFTQRRDRQWGHEGKIFCANKNESGKQKCRRILGRRVAKEIS